MKSTQYSVKPELLAPAGSMDALKLAVNCGADAVYFGAASFHARRAAERQIIVREAVDYCHLYGVKAYLALNINIKNKEFEDVIRVIREAYSSKIDAFIITDLGLLPALKEHAPGVPLHASTQLGVATKEGAEFLKSLGFSRVILAREVGLKEIQEIKETGLEVEYFVHGALCVSFSGSCLMSSVMTGNSGNRGLCKQPCRLAFSLKVGSGVEKTGYNMSPKDQCLLSKMEELQAVGVNSFKIEGRLKRDAYQGGVTAVYRKILDGKSIENGDISTLKRLYNRGEFSEGYAFSKKNDLMYPAVQGNIGEKIANISSIQAERAFFNTKMELSSGDGFKILRDGKEVDRTIQRLKKEKFSLYSADGNGLCIGDEIRITTDDAMNQQILEAKKKIKIDIKCEFLQGKPAKVEAFYKNMTAACTGLPLEAAKNAPLSKDSIRESLEKMGDTAFEIFQFEVDTDGVFLPKSAINALRRDVCEQLTQKIIASNTPQYVVKESPKFLTQSKLTGIFLQVDTLEKALCLPRNSSTFVVFAPESYQKEKVGEFVYKVKEHCAERPVFLYTPPIIMSREIEILTKILPLVDGVVANNIAVLQLAFSMGKQVICGVSLNIMNTNNPLIAFSNGYMTSVELNHKESEAFFDGILYAYGNLPVMHLRHCPKQTYGDTCKTCKPMDKIVLKDQKYEYTVLRSKFGSECQFRVLNPINADLGKYASGRNLYLDFSLTKLNAIDKIFLDYYNGTRESVGEYTLLHTKRGVL